jgi:predicted peroxiredoxin
VRGLTIVMAESDAERLRAALTLAATNAALGGRTRVFCQSEAVRLLADRSAPRDPAYVAAGLPSLAELFEEALGLGVEIIACQSGLHLTGIAADGLDPRIGYGGPVSVMQTLGDDRLLLA